MKNPKILLARDTACIRCSNSLKFCESGYLGHAHMLAKVDVISCMVANTPCTSWTVQVGRQGMSRSTFFTSTKQTQICSRIGITMASMHAMFILWHFMHFLGFSRWKTLKHGSDVTQHAFGLNSFIFLWGTTLFFNINQVDPSLVAWGKTLENAYKVG